MSLDEPRNWRHAEQIESGQIPEVTAASKIADLLGKHQDPRWLTPAALQYQAGKIVAHRVAIGVIFRELDGDPKRLPERDTVLRQQSTSSLSDEDHILERLHHLKAEESYLNGCLAAMGSVYAPALVDRDARGEREDDERISRDRRDEKALHDQPRWAS